MKTIASYANKLLSALVVIILAIMSCLVFVNVVLRYGFNSGIAITEEISRYMFVWLTFLGAVLAFADNQHVNVTLFTAKLSTTTRQYLTLVTDGAMLFCCYLMVEGSLVQYQLNLVNLAPISGLPQGITYLAAVVAGALIALLLVFRLLANLAMLLKGELQ